MRIPKPYIRYHFYSDHPTYVTGGDAALAGVCDVSVSADSIGRLRVHLTGPMLKKDGTPGRHHRGSTANLREPQPEWLRPIIEDARRRLT